MSHCDGLYHGNKTFCGSFNHPALSCNGIVIVVADPVKAPFGDFFNVPMLYPSVIPNPTGPIQVSHSNITTFTSSPFNELKSPENEPILNEILPPYDIP